MNPITLRKLPPEVEKLVKRQAARGRISPNRAVIELLAQACRPQAAGRKPRRRYHDLDDWFGKWSRTEAREFDVILAEIRGIGLLSVEGQLTNIRASPIYLVD